MTIKELAEKRANVAAEMKSISDKIGTENREFTPELPLQANRDRQARRRCRVRTA
jgi:hypothetical protein